MTSAIRNPAECPHLLTMTTSGEKSCHLLSRIIGVRPGSVAVKQDACDACCRFPLPKGPVLNPVLAALVHDTAEQSLTIPSLRVEDQIRCRSARAFATPWLGTESELSHQPAAGRSDSGNASSALQRRSSVKHECRVGLVGWNSAFGLGHMNRAIVRHLKIDRWLMPSAGIGAVQDLPCRADIVARPMSVAEMEAWLDGLDALLFAESPVFPELTAVAGSLGVKVVCIPNWEWIHPGLSWLPDVDLMICPVRSTSVLLQEWKASFDFQWEVTQVDWPVSIADFTYRNRRKCRRFVFVNGSGGVAGYDGNGTKRVRRKGLDVLLQAAELIPEIPIVVYADPSDLASCSPNVEVRSLPDDNRLLYCDGDVLVQPSHWEGLGLPLLECQAAGMPLITTDAAPMNEHSPIARIPVAATEAVFLSPDLCIPAAMILPQSLANTLASVYGQDISHASRQAREFVERHHNWSVAGPHISHLLTKIIQNSN